MWYTSYCSRTLGRATLVMKLAAAAVVVSRHGPLSIGLMASIITSQPASAARSAAQATLSRAQASCSPSE